MNHKENAIREQRTIEATKKNLMGQQGKFGVILKVYGEPIIGQTTGLFDAFYLDDPYETDSNVEYESTVSGQKGPLQYRDEISTADDGSIYVLGTIFDGLRRGLHLEIIHSNVDKEIKVTYKGYLVYKEVVGELEAYVPSKEWEDIIDKLYKTAKPLHKKQKVAEEKLINEVVEIEKASWWDRMRRKWGV